MSEGTRVPITAELDEERGAVEAERLETPLFSMPDGMARHLVKAIAVCFSLFQLYTAGFGVYEQYIQRSVHLAFGLALIALTYRFGRPSEGKRARVSMADWMLFALSLFAALWVVFNHERLMARLFWVDPLLTGDVVAGVLLTLIVLEVSRRTVSGWLTVLAVVFMAYGYFGYLLPGHLQAPPTGFDKLLETIYLSGDGILGVPLGVSATYVFLFILFGGFIMHMGLMKFLADIALSIAGSSTGGPAKVAVLCSAFFGTLSGSGIANAITTGSFTVPLMKRVGYKPHFAAGVEATASMGGNIMPPVMGAAAFVMADFLRVDYVVVAAAGIIPAVLYFFGVGSMVHFEALRQGMARIPREDLPRFWATLREGWYRLIPVIVLIYALTSGSSVTMSGLLAIISTLPVSWLKKETRITPKKLLHILEWGALTALPVIAAVAVVGILIGVIAHTGFAVKLAGAIVSLSHGFLFPTLVLAMIASLVLGLGLPTTPTYIVTAALTAPVLIRFGLEPLTAHFFVFYYGILADITPPTAIASYALAGIAGANPNKTMNTAFVIALAGYIVPFVFAYEPAMLDPFLWRPGTTLYSVVASTLSAGIGIIMLSMALIGWWRIEATLFERLVLAAGAVMLVAPGIVSDATGIAALIVVLVTQTRRRNANRSLAAIATKGGNLNG
jgi:TRAP transporter 4TM/12TM fusion protein